MSPVAFAVWIKYVIWMIFTKVGLGTIYIAVISEGLRYMVPALGQRLYKIPGLGFLEDFEETHGLDLAPFMAIFLLIAVFWLWERILHIWLASDEEGIDWLNETKLLMVLGTSILGADAILFYIAMTQVGWGGTVISISALLATVAYVAILVFVSYVTVTLRTIIYSFQGE